MTQRLIVTTTEIRNDEDLVAMLEEIRSFSIDLHGEIDEWAGLIRVKLDRFGRGCGMYRTTARLAAREMVRPLVRAADQLLAAARYARVCRNRFEAFLTALDDERPRSDDFNVRNRAA